MPEKTKPIWLINCMASQCQVEWNQMQHKTNKMQICIYSQNATPCSSSDVNKARTLKAKAKHYQGQGQGQGHGHPNAKAYDEIWSNEILFFPSTLTRIQAQFNNFTHHWHDT